MNRIKKTSVIYFHFNSLALGPGLLQGIAFCGICGKKMSVQYCGRKQNGTYQPMYICNYGYRQYCTGSKCQSIAGGNIDITIGELLLETINPLTIDAAVSIQREMTERREEIIRLYGQQMERTRYEMDLAKRRYLRVDPDNRLVAAELERDWNQKTGEYESAKIAYEQKCEDEVRAVDEEMRLALEQLVSDFPKIWNDPQTSNIEKKRISRLILEDVTITDGSTRIILGIRFKGGSTKVIEIPRIKRSLHIVSIEKSAISEIQSLRSSGLTYQEIIDSLKEKGFKNPFTDTPFSIYSVRSLMKRYGIPLRREITISNADGWMTAKEKMAELGVGKEKFRRMRDAGELVFKQSLNPNSRRYLYKAQNRAVEDTDSILADVKV